MADFTINAQPRTITGKKVKRLRNDGLVPVVLYGPKVNPIHLQIPYRPLEVALMKAGGTNLIDINADGQTHTVITRDVQRDAIRGTILHADFFVVDEDTAISADVSIHIIGHAPAVDEGLLLLAGSSQVTVSALPSKLPNVIEIDVSNLTDVGDSIAVRDIDLGEGATILNDPDEVLARVDIPRAAPVVEEGEEDDLEGEVEEGGEVEVIAKGKEEDEEEE